MLIQFNSVSPLRLDNFIWQRDLTNKHNRYVKTALAGWKVTRSLRDLYKRLNFDVRKNIRVLTSVSGQIVNETFFRLDDSFSQISTFILLESSSQVCETV